MNWIKKLLFWRSKAVPMRDVISVKFETICTLDEKEFDKPLILKDQKEADNGK